ncbi:carbohydrate porin [Novosphingobium sp. MW5]|nr:carbohydrate porin [Novosphingobium sp. MW5]
MLLHGNSFSENFVRDGQVVSNVDAGSTVRPIEIWAKANIGEKAYAKLGVIDLNSEFDVQDVGGHFINSSHGIGPDFSQSGLNGPSIFPNTSFGLVGGFSDGGLAVRLGAFDALPGTPDHPGRLVVRLPGDYGALLVGEVELQPAEDAKFVLGAWHYTKPFEMLTASPQTANSSGIYALLQGRLAESGSGNLDGWIRTGAASSAVNPIAHYVGGGLTFGSDDQRGGMAIAHARLGEPGRRSLALDGVRAAKAETIIEATYSHRVAEGVQVQPNVQYVINPGWDQDRSDALVVGIRLSFGIRFD